MTRSQSLQEFNAAYAAGTPIVKKFVTEVNKNSYFILDGFTEDYSAKHRESIEQIKEKMLIILYNQQYLITLTKG